MIELSPQQANVLRYVVRVTEKTGFVPTLREICAAFDWTSTNAASDILRALERKGYVERKGKGMSYRVLP